MGRLRNILGFLTVIFIAVYAIFANPDVSFWSSFYFIKQDFTVVFLCSLLICLLSDGRDIFLKICIKGVFYWHLMTLMVNLFFIDNVVFFDYINRSYITGGILVFILITFLMLESKWIKKKLN